MATAVRRAESLGNNLWSNNTLKCSRTSDMNGNELSDLPCVVTALSKNGFNHTKFASTCLSLFGHNSQ